MCWQRKNKKDNTFVNYYVARYGLTQKIKIKAVSKLLEADPSDWMLMQDLLSLEKNRNVCDEIIRLIDDQDVLEMIGFYNPVIENRISALNKMYETGVLKDFRLYEDEEGYSGKYSDIRYQKLFKKILTESNNDELRRKVSGYLYNDCPYCVELALHDRDEEVRIHALYDVLQPSFLYKVINEADNSNVRVFAAGNLYQDLFIDDLALNCKHADVRRYLAGEVRHKDVLSKMALEDSDASVRKHAAEKISDESILIRIADNDSDDSVRNAAEERLRYLRSHK